MSVKLRSETKYLYLIGETKHQITGSKLPSNGQVLAVLFYNIREVNLTVNASANLTIRECIIFWEKARIPIKSLPNCVKKLLNLYQAWRDLQKNAKKSQHVFMQRQEEFVRNLDYLFDIAHADALHLIKIEEDKLFLQRQREPGRPGHLGGVDKKLADVEERSRIRTLREENYRRKYDCASTSLVLQEPVSADSASECSLYINPQDDLTDEIENTRAKPDTSRKARNKNFITPKLVAALDRCQLSVRDSMFIIEATVEALGFNNDEFPISKSSLHRIRKEKRKERAEAIKIDFQNNVPHAVIVHWDGKLLPAIDARKSQEERLPVVISYGNEEQLIAVTKMDNSTGKEQAHAVWAAISDWNLEDKVQVLCCDATASNTGRITGACVLLEQKLERDILVFACRHHIYELVLKGVFEAKMKQKATSPDIPLFKNFRENWKNVDILKTECYKEKVKSCLSASEIDNLLQFYRSELTKKMVSDDYRELIELSIIFLGGDETRQFKIRPPGAMHRARWMAKAIYALKMSLFSSQLKLNATDKKSLLDVSLFIVTIYVKPWVNCILAFKAPYNDLCFLKSLKAYENVDETISKAALQKFIGHLWYLIDEIATLSLFDDDVDQDTKVKMVANLSNNNCSANGKRYIPSKEELCGALYGKFSMFKTILRCLFSAHSSRS